MERQVEAVKTAKPPSPSPSPSLQDAEREKSARAPPLRSIVVLPFTNRSGDAGQDYRADALTDELTTDLARLPRYVRHRAEHRL